MYNNYNPYYGQQQRPLQQQFDLQQPIQPYIPQTMPTMAKNNVLQGKVVSSIEEVKASEIPMDGSSSYFVLSDGSSIVTKQLQIDGTSKITIYKPIEEKETPKEEIKYITQDELDEYLNKFDFDSINDELKDIKKEIKDIKKEMK